MGDLVCVGDMEERQLTLTDSLALRSALPARCHVLRGHSTSGALSLHAHASSSVESAARRVGGAAVRVPFVPGHSGMEAGGGTPMPSWHKVLGRGGRQRIGQDGVCQGHVWPPLELNCASCGTSPDMRGHDPLVHRLVVFDPLHGAGEQENDPDAGDMGGPWRRWVCPGTTQNLVNLGEAYMERGEALLEHICMRGSHCRVGGRTV